MNARRTISLLTSFKTGALEENINARSLWKKIINNQKKRPMIIDVITDTTAANLAPFPLPAPSSFATRTLYYFMTKTLSPAYKINNFEGNYEVSNMSFTKIKLFYIYVLERKNVSD